MVSKQAGKEMLKIIFLCTGNSCRSQMAEGIANNLMGGKIISYSAGLEPKGFVHPKAIEVMKEIGIDISKYTSKPIDLKLLNEVDYIITLCDDAEETCPVTPAKIKRLHWGLSDPAKATGTEEDILNTFRQIRDEIKEKILRLLTISIDDNKDVKV